MTTGGYISPAVEGKMPEAIVPDIIGICIFVNLREN